MERPGQNLLISPERTRQRATSPTIRIQKNRLKIMKIGILFAALLSLAGTSAFASSWNSILLINLEDAEYYFDAESVLKTKDGVTLWVKNVRKNSPEEDGVWSTALNWRINCQKRTVQMLSWSTYDSTGKFIKSNSNGGSEKPVTPDSIGEEIHKVACMADFPKNTPATKNSYLTVPNNDIFAFTKGLVEYKKSQVDKAPK
jgi:hypothetical protein